MTLTIDGKTIEADSPDHAIKLLRAAKRAEKKQYAIDQANYKTACLHAYANLGRILETKTAIDQWKKRGWYILDTPISASGNNRGFSLKMTCSRGLESGQDVTFNGYTQAICKKLENNSGYVSAVCIVDVTNNKKEWFAIGEYQGQYHLVECPIEIDLTFLKQV